MVVRFAPYAPGWLADPYREYRELRTHDPVHWSDELEHWVLTRHRDVVSVQKDGRFTATNRPPQRRWQRPTMMVTADPPDHARLRRPVHQRFLAAAVEELRPRVEQLVDELLEPAAANGRMDVVRELARPLPRTIIAELLGVPVPSDRPVGRPAGDATDGERQRPEAGPGAHMSTEMPPDRFFLDAIDRHREELQDDLLNDLLTAEAGRTMSAEEVLDTATILYVAGQETTAKLISNGLYHLLKRPAQLEKLRREPALIASATEELLRFDPPVHAISRRALEDVELGGRTVHRDQKVLCLLAAANRDPEVFPQPDELDIERPDNNHVTFGIGIHTCLGNTLARIEIQSAVGALIARFPKLRLATDEVEWEGSLIIRGVKSLPVELG